MIREKDLTRIGRLLKPHGIAGELVMLLTADVDMAALECVILPIDGIFVPFFINSCRPKSSETDLIGLDGINDETQAARLCPSEVYALTAALPARDPGDEDGFYAEDLVGFTALDSESGKELGKITGIDTTTANYLFIIETPDRKAPLLVPVADELIDTLDPDARTIGLSLPEGLTDL